MSYGLIRDEGGLRPITPSELKLILSNWLRGSSPKHDVAAFEGLLFISGDRPTSFTSPPVIEVIVEMISEENTPP